jgi:hypothetical protein
MDMWAKEMFPHRFASTLSMAPSDYFARNIRVTSFHFEAVVMYFERYPHLADVFCYSTDYPHFKGGNESKRVAGYGGGGAIAPAAVGVVHNHELKIPVTGISSDEPGSQSCSSDAGIHTP